jgi:hypothetical protein
LLRAAKADHDLRESGEKRWAGRDSMF